MSTLAKLRALHEEICRAWRAHNAVAISEGEAEILNLGFSILERLARASLTATRFTDCVGEVRESEVSEYLKRVHSQFDTDADIKITEANTNE